jgi:hypothetical protein
LENDPNEIELEEIRARGGDDLTAHRLIQRLRPAWLLGRGQTSLTNPEAAYPVVYVDGVRHGGLDTLVTITSNQIRRMTYTGAADATTRWGTGHPAGVISIETGREPYPT